MRLAFLLLGVIAVACNGNGGKPDADLDGDAGGDYEPVEGFRLVFEEGARACGVFED